MSLITPDFGLIFWMVLIFGAVFFLLAKFGFPVITRAVQKRSDHISESLKAAEQARLELENTAMQQQRMLEETRAEQGRILQEASRARDAMLSGAREEAEAEASRILQNARAEIAAEKEAAMKEVRMQVSALSVAVAEKIVRKDLEQTPEQLSLLERMADEAAQTPLN